MTVTLINATRRMKVINLPHATYCAAVGTCACDPFPAVLTLAAGESASGLDGAVLRVANIAREVRSGDLRVRRETPLPKTSSRSRSTRRRSGRKKAR